MNEHLELHNLEAKLSRGCNAHWKPEHLGSWGPLVRAGPGPATPAVELLSPMSSLGAEPWRPGVMAQMAAIVAVSSAPPFLENSMEE